MEIVLSHNTVPIRLTSERWVHIVENHDDLAGQFHDVLETVAEPDMILEGQRGEMLAIRTEKSRTLVVVYKETVDNDGFVITAFQTSSLHKLIKIRKIVWQKSN